MKAQTNPEYSSGKAVDSEIRWRLFRARRDGGKGLPAVNAPAGLAAAIIKQITEHPETYAQEAWHSDCRTKHCVAGWAVTLAGDDARSAEALLGTACAARLALGLSLDAVCPFGPADDPLPWLRKLAVEGRPREEELGIDA